MIDSLLEHGFTVDEKYISMLYKAVENEVEKPQSIDSIKTLVKHGCNFREDQNSYEKESAVNKIISSNKANLRTCF